MDQQTVTVPSAGKIIGSSGKLVVGATVTHSTGVMDFARVEPLLSKTPLRKPIYDKLHLDHDLADISDTEASLAEPGESVAYDELRKELGLDE